MELRIEIEPGSDPIAGVVHVGDVTAGARFTGWMSLVELIAAAVADLGDSSPDGAEHR